MSTQNLHFFFPTMYNIGHDGRCRHLTSGVPKVCVWDIHECESAIRYRELSWWFLQFIGLVQQWVTLNLHSELLQLLHYTKAALNEKLYMDILYNCPCIIQLLHSRFITENGKVLLLLVIYGFTYAVSIMHRTNCFFF